MLGLTPTRLLSNNLSRAATRSMSLRRSFPAAYNAAALFHSFVPILPVDKSAVTEATVGKMLSLSLVPMIGVAVFYGPQSINDLLLGVVFPLHAYIGVNSSVVDYFPKRRSPVLYRLFKSLLVAGTAFALYGCWVINTKDVGLTALTAKLWHANKPKSVE